MADSSFEKGLTELNKMKVADLRAELKQRGLPITGNKNELVERLQLAMHDTSLSLDEATDEIDEDAVLGDEEIESEGLAAKPDSPVKSEKRKLAAVENTTPAKKVVLNRKTIVEEIKADQVQKEEEANTKAQEPTEPEKKVIKLSEVKTNEVKTDEVKTNEVKVTEVDTAERLEMRAKKFGVPLSETAKKEARAARFNITADGIENSDKSKSAASIKNSNVNTTYEVLKKRAERFGTNVSTLMEKAELEDKIEKRKARFGEIKAVDKVAATKIKLVK